MVYVVAAHGTQVLALVEHRAEVRVYVTGLRSQADAEVEPLVVQLTGALGWRGVPCM